MIKMFNVQMFNVWKWCIFSTRWSVKWGTRQERTAGRWGKRTGRQTREEDGDREAHGRRGQMGRWKKMQECVGVERHCGVVDGREWVIEIKIWLEIAFLCFVSVHNLDFIAFPTKFGCLTWPYWLADPPCQVAKFAWKWSKIQAVKVSFSYIYIRM